MEIPASQYHLIFLVIVTIFTIFVSMRYKDRDGLIEYEYPSNNEITYIILVIFMIIFIGTRPLSGYYFVDMANYAETYFHSLEGARFNFDWTARNFVFDNMFALIGSMRLGLTFFYVLMAAIFYGTAYLGIRRIFPNHKLAAYLVFLAAFSTFSYSVDGLKAGAAGSLFIWAYSYRDKLKICIPLVLLSWGFHHSMQLPVAAFVLSLFYKNSKLYFYAWLFCLIMAIGHVGFFANLFAGMSDETGSEYLRANGENAYISGFRLDFIIYSSVPVIIGYLAIFRRKLQISETYRELLHLYLCTNGIWMLCMYASYTNRIAYLSWFIYPVVLIYPFLYEDWGEFKYNTFSKVMLCHLGFTLFMYIVYYGTLFG